MTLTLDQMAAPAFQVTCRARPAGDLFYLTPRGTWTHHTSNLEPATYASRMAAWRALRRAYRHPADDHATVQVAGFTARSPRP